ncbi:MAG TPA: hypothetical protein VHT02_00320, partial [Methylocella sp.]|nr:hypothetical protein [Methylocella sp.]
VGWSANAADIKIADDKRFGDVVLEGTIVAGDYDKLRKLVEDEDCTPTYYRSTWASSIYLASPGGSVVEAMKIGRLVRTLWRTTLVTEDVPADLHQKIVTILKLQDPESNYLCASACFFVAVGGIERSTFVDTVFLGIHQPNMSDTDLRAVSANQAIASATQVRTIVEAYLKEMSAPAKYADLMFSIPKDQVRWISETDFKTDFAGLVPELKG